MATIRPFNAMMYKISKNEELEALCCPPYDIISPQQQEKLYTEAPHNAIHLELAPGEGEARYANAAANLNNWLSAGVLTDAGSDALYLYEEDFVVGGQKKYVRGLIARVKLEEFEKGIVLPHEETLSKAKQDRYDLMMATGCNFSQVYSMFVDDEHRITPKISAISDREPEREFTDADGVTHRLWIENDPATCAAICDAFADKQLFIADGHHRYETAIRYRNTIREKNGGDAGNAEYVMMMLVDIDQFGLVVLPTHRMLFNLENYDSAAILSALSESFDVTEIEKDNIDSALSSATVTTFVFYTEGHAYLVAQKDANLMYRYAPHKSAAYRSLDVAVLHQAILEPMFGIGKEQMAAGTNLKYTRDAKEALNAVDAGDAQAAFIINPTRVRQIKDVALAGEKMPQKSTYFYPKLITGLVFNNFKF